MSVQLEHDRGLSGASTCTWEELFQGYACAQLTLRGMGAERVLAGGHDWVVQ